MAKNTGLQNERELCKALHNKTLGSIEQPHLREFIMDIFNDNVKATDLINCRIVESQTIIVDGVAQVINVKQDLELTVNGQKKNIQVKKGKSNSVHEESLDSFIEFIKTLGANDEVIKSILKFQWADGTLDNTGAPENRLKGNKVKENYAKEMDIVHCFLNNNRLPIIKRVLCYGAYEDLDSYVDFFYHGTIDRGVWCSLDYAISVNENMENTKGPISVGFLTYQNQNRNTTLNPNKENARKKIQFKWSNMEAILEKSMTLRSRLQLPIKLGSNKHGFENQDMIINALNGEKIGNLRTNLRKFIMDMFPDASTTSIITCEEVSEEESIEGKPKGTFDVTVGNQTVRVLVKIGRSQSVHQEKYESFYNFISSECGASEEVINRFREFQWADGSLDGSNYDKRLNKTNEIKEKYSESINVIREFINQPDVARKCLERFLKTGANSAFKTNDYLYIGNLESAYWASIEDIINLQLDDLNRKSSATLNIGSINIKNWGRSKHKTKKTDQRNEMQAMLSNNIINDIKLINKTNNKESYYKLGEKSERNFVQLYNSKLGVFRKKMNERLALHKNNHDYAVQVNTKQTSALINKKVNAKSDAYIITTINPLNEQLLYENEYLIEEDNLENIEFTPITESGVSIKRPDSRSFTYAKFNRNSFEALFDNRSELFVGALLYVKNRDELYKNDKMLFDNDFTLEKLKTYFNLSQSDDEITMFKEIKNQSVEEISNMIKSDSKIYDAVFFGTNIFVEPYCASYLFTDILEHKDDLRNLEFGVTTGSGRSKGDYTIIIKP